MWDLEKLPARGGMLGSTSPNTFESHGFEAEEDLLIRETTQNSTDNPASKSAKPKIVIRAVTLSGERKKQFLKAARLKDLYGNHNLLARSPQFSELRTLSSDGRLGLIFIEDFNTTGLDGDIDDPRGNWMRFNLHGDAAKLEEQEKIGSYGYGKSVLSRAAGTNTFIVYSAFKQTGDGATARLMGHTFQPWYPDGKENKSGRGWFCKSCNSDQDPIPFRDQEAHDLAQALGFTRREAGQTGTSFLLIGNVPAKRPITIKAIRRAFETWWWPSLIDNQLDVELWENGKRVDDPAPRERKDLVPYLACKAKLDGDAGDDVEEVKFQREHNKEMGRLALTVAADETIFDHPLHPKSPGPRRVARMRVRSGMITEYKEFGTARRLSFAGFYCGSKDVDDVLRFSEPKEHDKWSNQSQRLARLPHGPEIVERIEERTHNHCLQFQRANSAARAPVSERLPELERLLGAAFTQLDGPIPPPPPPPPPGRKRYSVIEFPDSPNGRPTPVFGKTRNHLDFLVRYSLKPEYGSKKKVLEWLHLNVAEEALRVKGEPLVVEIIDQKDGRVVHKGPDPSFAVELIPGKSRTFRVKSATYPRHQVLLFNHGEAQLPGAGK